MQITVSAFAYESILSELFGVSFLLGCMAQAAASGSAPHATEGLYLLKAVVEKNAAELNCLAASPND